MEGLFLIIVCLAIGKILSISRLAKPQEIIRILNILAIRVSLPALILDKVHSLDIQSDAYFLIIAPWIGFIVVFLAIYILQKFIPMTPVTAGCFILLCGTSNTSFVGLPLIHAILGPSAINSAIILDQSNLILLFTVGILIANIYSGHDLDIKQMAIRILVYPPVIALMIGFILRPLPYPYVIQYSLETLGSLLTPLTMLSIGCSLSLPRNKNMIQLISIGLLIKLILVPAVIASLLLFIFTSVSPMTSSVALLQVGMAPMAMAVIIAADKNLNPELANFLTSLGIPISFITVLFWYFIWPYTNLING